MKVFSIVILSLCFTFTVFGQEPSTERSNKIEYVIYGRYCGECRGNCAQMYKLVNNELLIDTTKNYFYNYNRSTLKDSQRIVVFEGKALSKAQYLKAKKLIDSIPAILYKSESRTFGKPDNRDQCGIFLQIKTSDKLKTFYIDMDLTTIPTELWDYATLIMGSCDENGNEIK